MGNGLKEFKNLPLLNEALKGAGRKIVQTRCGYGHTAALDSKGVPLVWGRGDCGQLGLRDAVVEKKHQAMAAYREKPVEVEFFSARSSFGRGETVKVTDLALGNDFSMCIVGDTTSK